MAVNVKTCKSMQIERMHLMLKLWGVYMDSLILDGGVIVTLYVLVQPSYIIVFEIEWSITIPGNYNGYHHFIQL